MTVAVDYWRGGAGDAYQGRNLPTCGQLRARIQLWNDILRRLKEQPQSVLEVGAGAGINLWALSLLNYSTRIMAVEPNATARQQLLQADLVDQDNLFDGTANKIPLEDGFADLVFTSGVLIHIPPDDLLRSCAEIRRISRRYIVSIEYFADDPEMKSYRGELDRLWKRDFGKYWIEHFGLKPIGCGFAWKETTGLDNLTYWIFEK